MPKEVSVPKPRVKGHLYINICKGSDIGLDLKCLVLHKYYFTSFRRVFLAL